VVSTVRDLTITVNLAERHVSSQLRLAYLAPEVLKRLTCGREASAISLYDLCFLAGEGWRKQEERALGDGADQRNSETAKQRNSASRKSPQDNINRDIPGSKTARRGACLA
jgi:hypothetical protein